MIYWKNVLPGPKPPEVVYAIIECPKGTQNKYEMSKRSNLIKLDRVLHSSVIYPEDYGFIPGTLAEDGDPLDILVLITHSTYPLTIIECKPIGALVMEDENGLDEKILSVASHDPFYNIYKDINHLPNHYLNEISEFFRTYKNLEEKSYAEVKEWKDKNFAYTIISKSIETFQSKYGDLEQTHP
ncbi:MAG: inorganic diphosphatase [Candidatus Lokiarchaeota archaeon]